MTLATPQDACVEFARNVGRDHPELAWISTPFDSWQPNPFYVGPPVPHPEQDEPTDTDGEQDHAPEWSGFDGGECDDTIPF